MPEVPLTIRLFGRLEVRLRGELLPRLRSRRVAWTLALLVLRHRQGLGRDWLAGTLWPDSAAGQASYNLRRSLSELRRALGAEAWRITAPGYRAVALDLSGAEVDLVCFDEAIQRADVESLARAVAVYAGPLLEGCTEEWVLPEREVREQAYLQALERLASEALSSGDAASAVAHLRRAVAVEPLRESAQRMLLEALAARGEYGEAVQSYRALRLLLWDELRTEPSPETRAAYERIREQARGDGRRGAARAKGRARHPSTPPAALLPPIWNVPHRRNPNFTGRRRQLSAIAATLARGGPAALTQAFVGLGGIGKTQLALEHAYRHAGDYRVVWWVRAEEPAQLVADYAALAGPLDLPEKTAVNQRAVAAAARRWLERSDGWLLILDNAPGPAAVVDHLPRAGGGHVLITSRDQHWGSVAAPVSVPVLPQEEAVAFLQKRTGWSGPEVEALAEELGQLPLALEQAAAYAATTGCSPSAYRDLFRSRRRALLQRQAPPEGYQWTVGSTWSLAIAQAASECPAAEGLLKLCSYLAPDGIPLSLVQEGAVHLPAPLAEAARDLLLLHAAVAALQRYSLVSMHEDALSVHRLVQAVVRDGLCEEEQRQWAAAAVRITCAGFPTTTAELWSRGEWSVCALYLPHALAAADLALPLASPDWVRDIAWLLCWVGRYLELLGHYGPATACLRKSVECIERVLGPAHRDLILPLYQLSDHVENPRPLRERSLAIAEKEDKPSVPWLLVALARALCQEGDDARAAALCEQALARMPRGSGPPPLLAPDVWDTSTGGIRLKLAYLRTRLGDLAGAKRSAKQAAAALEEAFPPDHPERGWGPWCLAYVLAHQGDYREEKRQWERALEFWQRVFPPGHPRVTLAQFPLGLYSEPAFGDLAAARAHLETAHQSAGHAHGWEHPFTGGILFGLAQVTHLGGDLAAARALWEEALAVAEKAQQYGEGTPSFRYRAWEFADFAIPTITGMRLSVRSALDRLASVLLDLGDLEGAQGHLERALTMPKVICGEWPGPDREGIAEVLPALARLRRLQGRLEEAKAALGQSLAVPEDPSLPHPSRIATTHLEYGLTLQALGDLDGAREHLTQAIAMFERRLGPQHPRTERARRDLAALGQEGTR